MKHYKPNKWHKEALQLSKLYSLHLTLCECLFFKWKLMDFNFLEFFLPKCRIKFSKLNLHKPRKRAKQRPGKYKTIIVLLSRIIRQWSANAKSFSARCKTKKKFNCFRTFRPFYVFMIAWGFENVLSFKLESTTRALTLKTFNDTWGKNNCD